MSSKISYKVVLRKRREGGVGEGIKLGPGRRGGGRPPTESSPLSEAQKFTTFSAETRVTLGNQPWGFLGAGELISLGKKAVPQDTPLRKGIGAPVNHPQSP